MDASITLSLERTLTAGMFMVEMEAPGFKELPKYKGSHPTRP